MKNNSTTSRAIYARLVSASSRTEALTVSHIQVLMCAQEKPESTNQRDVITKIKNDEATIPRHNIIV